MTSKKAWYFASDFHLGMEGRLSSRERELQLCSWMDEIKHDAIEVFLVGDIFDYWYEYKRAIPKGFSRFLGKVAELCDAGIPIHFFTGNHDIWMFDYFEKELGVTVQRSKMDLQLGGKRFLIAHGDGLGPGDIPFKRLKKVFTNRGCQWAYSKLHPDLTIRFAHAWSSKSRNQDYEKNKFISKENEWLYQYALGKLKSEHYDFFIFGHRHIPLDLELPNNSRYLNMGEWLHNNSYLRWDGDQMEKCFFEFEGKFITS